MKIFPTLALLFVVSTTPLFASDSDTITSNSFTVKTFPMAPFLSGFALLPVELQWTTGDVGIKAFYNHSYNTEIISKNWMGIGLRRFSSKKVDASWFGGINLHYMEPAYGDGFVQAIGITYEVGREKSFQRMSNSFSFEFGFNVLHINNASNGDSYEGILMLYTFFNGVGIKF